MTIRLNTESRNALADALGDQFDSGILQIRSGTQPASANDAATGTLLASITLPASAFTAAVSGVAAKAGTWSATVEATGTAGWFRFRNSGDTFRKDGSITEVAGGGDIELDDVELIDGGIVTINTYTITQPAS